MAFGVVQASAYDVTVDPQILRSREILHDETVYQGWFQRGEIGEPSQPIAAAGTTEAVDVEGEEP